MAFETKEEVLQHILSQEKPICPHCGAEMSIWEMPQIPFEEGSGWGTPYLFVCFNNHCPMYLKGWDHVKDNYGHHASYRCVCYPGTDQFESMVVFSSMGATGQIIDEQEQIVAKQRKLKADMKVALFVLDDCYRSKDWQQVLKILLDPKEPKDLRIKAAEIVGDIGALEVIEPMKNHKFRDDLLSSKVEDAVKEIHERHFTRECPFCAEIIKNRAKVCKHCGKIMPCT